MGVLRCYVDVSVYARILVNIKISLQNAFLIFSFSFAVCSL